MSNSDKLTQTIDLADELLYIATKPSEGKYRISYRGYKNELLAEQLSSRENNLLLCSVCEGILLNASSDQGGDVLCECCVSDSISTPLLPIRRTVSKLLVKCPQYFRGCKWSGLISDIREHVGLCGYLYISCPQGCDESMLQQHTEEHVTSNCIEQMILCGFCMKLFKAKNLTEHHGVCPMYLIDCTKLCGLGMKRYQLEDHLKRDCPYRLVPCPYVKYGCDKTEIRYCYLKEHIDTKKDQHLLNLEKSHQKQEQTLNLNSQLVKKKDRGLKLKHQDILRLERENGDLKLKHQDILRLEGENRDLKSNMSRVEKENKRLQAFIFPQLIKVSLDVGCYQNVWQLTFGNGAPFKLMNETFYINLVREQNGRLYFAVQFPSPRKGLCLTVLLNQDESNESIVFQPMALNCKLKILVEETAEKEKMTMKIFPISSVSGTLDNGTAWKKRIENLYISHISSGIEESLLRYPFVKDGKVVLNIGFKSQAVSP